MESTTPQPVESQGTTVPSAEPSKLLLVDGHALVYRAYHALPADLRTSKGEATNATLGFTTMLMDTLRKQAPQYAVMTFDKGRTFRHEASADYKATRPGMPEDLRGQMARVRQITEALGIPIVELAGFEADDLIGTLSLQAEHEGLETIILTGDNDQHQLVSDSVKVVSPGGYANRFSDARVYDVPAVYERYGFGPKLVPDYKALVGDKSDNIPNVPGIGDKTAAVLLQKYGSLEGILEHIDELKPKVAESLRSHTEQAISSKNLATIVRDAPVHLDLEASHVGHFDREKVTELLRELEFRRLLGTLGQVESALQGKPESSAEGDGARTLVAGSVAQSGPQQMSLFGDSGNEAGGAPNTETHHPGRSSIAALEVDEHRLRAGIPPVVTVVRSIEQLTALAEKIRESGRFTVDVESTSAEEMDAQLVGISIALPAKDDRVDEGFYIPVGHLNTAKEGVPQLDESQLTIPRVVDVLGGIFADKSILKDGHNAKYDTMVLARAGLPVEGLGFDTMIAAYLLGRTSIGLKDLAFTELGVEMVPIEELIGKRGKGQKTMDLAPIETAGAYAAADVAVTERLRNIFAPELSDAGLLDLFNEVEMPLVGVLADMELTGVALDVPWLQRLSAEMHLKLGELQTAIYEQAGHEFNINSSQQLGSVLFDQLNLPGRKRTQTGYSTDKDVLDSLRGLHPIVDLITEYRQLIKLKNTYVDALPLLVRADTGRVHTSFNQTVAATGRLSSSQPNLQNVPIRTEIGRDVRKAFIADNSSSHRLFDEESVLLAADYSQVELRILASMADEERLVRAFEAGQDIHAATAAEVMGIPIEQVDPDSRRLAKTINFGVLYGMGSYGLARDSALSQAEAAKFIELYWSRYPAVRRFMDQTLQDGRRLGYVKTLLGRRRQMPELTSRNVGLRQQAERMAINAPVQGTAADIIKIAMNRLWREMREHRLRARMLLQVHDELLFEVPRSELEELGGMVRRTMEGAMDLAVPLKIDVKVGTNWGEMESLNAGS